MTDAGDSVASEICTGMVGGILIPDGLDVWAGSGINFWLVYTIKENETISNP
jgi:hypothetical protein